MANFRISVKDLSNFSRCPYLVRNKLDGMPPRITPAVAVGTMVHEARCELNATKRKFGLHEELPEHPEVYVAQTLEGLRLPSRLPRGEIFQKSLGIVLREWEWEHGMLSDFPLDLVYPIKMEDPLKFPPRIYGQADGILNDRGPLPIEYKTWNGGTEGGDELQLWAYCVGVEFKYRASVPFGVLQYSDPLKRIMIEFTPEARKTVLQTREEVESFLETGETSRKPDRNLCATCLYPACEFRVV
jgi:CRISPR/Cas system-associated exonuclease Cas4 (RecB family)